MPCDDASMSKEVGQSDALPDGESVEWPRPILEGEAREAVLGRVEQYLVGDAPPHSFFELGAFRDDDRRTMLVVQESC